MKCLSCLVLEGCNVVYSMSGLGLCASYFVCVFFFLFLVISLLSCSIVTVLVSVRFFDQ